MYDRNATRPVARLAATPHRLACGSYGVFEMDFSGSARSASSTDSLAGGREVPPRYPLLGTSFRHQSVPAGVALSVSSPDATSLDGGAPGIQRLEGAARPSPAPAPPPCADGSCFSLPGSDPWIAVVDWDDWHGWSVGQTILQSAGGAAEVALFPLNDEYLAPEFGDEVTDVHVLYQLCRIAEAVIDPAVSSPVAINMSFGRLAQSWDPIDGACDGTSLACQIVRVLEHLGRSGPSLAEPLESEAIRYGFPEVPLMMGAAGNHRELLFPASARPVVAVGALDLPVFKGKGRSYPAWETPDRVQALFPGHGVCLEYDVGRRQRAAWPAPPGTSYSTAMMTGWVTPSLLTGRLLPQEAAFWAPIASCRGRRCRLEVIVNGRALPLANGAAQKMMARSLNEKDTCGEAPATGPEIVRLLGDPMPLSVLPGLSFPAISPQLVQPAPEPSSCVPCGERNRRGAAGGAGRSLAPVGTVSGSSHKDKHGGGGDRVVDSLSIELWAAQGLDPEFTLENLYLRLGQELLPVNLEAGDAGSLASGDVTALTVEMTTRTINPGEQPSLVWVLRGPTEAGEASFWTSTPILLRR